MSLDNKTILLTGGTGSFGRKFTEIALAEHNPKVIRIFSRGELLQQEMQTEFGNDPRLRFFIGDVRDRERVSRAMNGVDIVVHAAALKQVPACEYNPVEAVRTNIDGTVNIVDAAIDNGVSKAFAISSDKAVHPVNHYGATKLVMEKLFTQANVYTGGSKTRFSCSRYGNVIGSRGSVIPIFLKQRENGFLTITNENMTRFWLTIETGVRFVINCIDSMEGGEIFVPKVPSMSVMQIAREIAPEAEFKIIGKRPGEKIHEELITEEEAPHTREFEDYYIIEPEFPFWQKTFIEGGTPLADGFKYTSDTNSRWISGEELRRIVMDAEKTGE